MAAAAAMRPARPLFLIANTPLSIRVRTTSRTPAFSHLQPSLRSATSRATIDKMSRATNGSLNKGSSVPSPSGGAATRGRGGVGNTASLEFLQNTIGMVAPLTIIAAPLIRFPRSPRDFLTYAWKCLRYKVLDYGGYQSIRLSSKPGLFGKARFQLDRKGIIPTAKALHRTFSEAVAAGDTATLRKVATDAMYNDFSEVIRRRPRGRRYGWELVRYNSAWRYPRISSHRIMPLPQQANMPAAAVHQVAVAIASRQRLVEYGDAPRGRAGGESQSTAERNAKQVDLVEHVVVTRLFDTKTYATTEWRLAGTMGETTLGLIQEDEALIKDMEQQEMAKYRSQ